jgi:hypothetical protein
MEVGMRNGEVGKGRSWEGEKIGGLEAHGAKGKVSRIGILLILIYALIR